MGGYHLFIACQKYMQTNNRAVFDKYLQEYDRCVLAGYDTYTCHHRGVYAANAAWPANYPIIPMLATLPDLPTLSPNLNPVTAPIGVGGFLRKDRGPPFGHPPPHTYFLPSSFTYWTTNYPGLVFAANLALQQGSWKNATAGAGVAGIGAVLATLEAPHSSKYPKLIEIKQLT